MTQDDMKRRFPPPWRAELMEGGYKILDQNGVPVAWVYAIDDAQRTLTATGWKTLTWDEARRIANGIAKLPELYGLRKRRG